MFQVDTSQPVMITGAAGYVASWVVRRLLTAGCSIQATVRDPEDGGRLRHLTNLAEELEGDLKLFKADLMDEGSFAAAMDGCRTIFHTASPYVSSARYSKKQLIARAKLGVTNVLQEANRHDSVKRIVYTSSCGAMFGDNRELLTKAEEELTEDDWNATSNARHLPRSFSKTIAEREAWHIAEQQDRWDLVTLNPPLVLGPGVNPYSKSDSYRFMKRLGNGSMNIGLPDYELGVVDVRDLTDAHLRAAWIPDAAGRYIICGHNSDILGIANRLHARFGLEYSIPTRTLPDSMYWMFGPMINPSLTRKFIRRNFGYPFAANHDKSIDQLDMHYRTLDETVTDMFQQMINHGRIKMRS